MSNVRYVLAERPGAGDVVPGKTFRRETVPMPKAEDLKDGEVLVENFYLGLDPAMRGWLNDKRSYMEPVKIDETMRGMTVGRVLASKSPKASKGDVMSCMGGWTQYSVLNDALLEPASAFPQVSQPYRYVSTLGISGLTAYYGMVNIGNPQPGDTVVVSSAAGATGSVAGQIAKIKGARVVGIAGSDDKCRWLKEDLGFDVALNYKDPEFEDKFKEATPNFINVYFDNVGGRILDMALGRAKENARFVACGMISEYNAKEPYPLKNITQVIAMRIKFDGFIILDHVRQWAMMREQLAKWDAEGKLKSDETIYPGGLDNVEKAFTDLFKGGNTGKLIVEIKKLDEAAKL